MVKLVAAIHNRSYSPWTIKDMKIAIRKFYRWLRGMERGTDPPETKWIIRKIPKNALRTPSPSQLLSKDDIAKILDVVNHPRNRALIAVLFESGFRISELANMSIGDIQFDKYGAMLKVHGKTGSRPVQLIISTRYLMTWLESHPNRHDEQAPLWINIGNTHRFQQMQYASIKKLIQVTFEAAGVNKRCNPHFFRHSIASYLANRLTEAQMCQYFGWVQSSRMPSYYIYLSGQELVSPILKLQGLANDHVKESDALKPQVCSRCDTLNQHDFRYCCKCAALLDQRYVLEQQELERRDAQDPL